MAASEAFVNTPSGDATTQVVMNLVYTNLNEIWS